jgi:hypothetical protein
VTYDEENNEVYEPGFVVMKKVQNAISALDLTHCVLR